VVRIGEQEISGKVKPDRVINTKKRPEKRISQSLFKIFHLIKEKKREQVV
jgi:hypothetical protein